MPDDPLAGGRILLTGATGFLGQATLERLLSHHPDTRVDVLIRRRGTQSAETRLRSLLRKPVFRPWRERVGVDAVTAAVADRVTIVEGGLSDVPTLPVGLTAVVHCASTVSFDPPIDEAFRTNLSGVTNLYEAVNATATGGERVPHVVHVSTAYVAGSRKGVVPEASLDHAVDWRAELAAALAARADVERDSRRPEVLDRALRRARAEHGKAGPQAIAKAAEEARRTWVSDRLVEYGRTRARSLGWPDVYTFTKALGERAAEELATGIPLSIVRPAIVESALTHPFPGWIDGFKMAEPIILAYGRGTLPEFPGTPDGIVDIVPVDIVTNALLAVAAAPPPAGDPAYYHVGSGARNPLSFRDLYEHVRGYFTANPMPDGDRGDVRVPTWTFPGSRQVERMLRTGERAAELADKALLRLPSGTRTRDWSTRLYKERQRLEFLRRYSDLYGVYTEAEVIYTDNRLLALHRSLPVDVQKTAGFDTAVVDWHHYLRDVHIPAVTESLRARSGRAGKTTPKPVTPGEGVLAVFDLEGTILASNVIEAYLWARLLELPKASWAGELAALAGTLPKYLAAERRDRGEFLRAFMRRYEGASEARLARLVSERIGDTLLRRSAPEAIRRVRRHRAAGHRTVLITGTIDTLVAPLSGLFDEIVASRLQVRDGVFTGFLDRPPLIGEARAAWVRRYARDAGLDLSVSWAYGDSYSDRPFLELVGNPVAVNPDAKLYRHAKRRRWTVEEWGAHTRSATHALLEGAR